MSLRPATGVRYCVERDPAHDSPGEVVYRGFVHLPDADLPVEVRVALPAGATRATLTGAGEARPDLEKAAAALVRTATKPAVAAGTSLPRRIVRWRDARSDHAG
jgi:hypothetical protein